MICDEIVSWASTCRSTLKQSSKTCSAGQKSSLVHSNSLYMLWFGTKSSHLGISVSRDTEILLKACSEGQKSSQVQSNCATGYDLQRNRLLGINVLRYTETVLENVLSRTENPQIQSKPSYKL